MNKLKPNFTGIPNAILETMSRFSGAETKVLMVICRKTYGWKKDTDKISASQFVKMTGLDVSTIRRVTRKLALDGVIAKSASQGGTKLDLPEYEINTDSPILDPSQNATPRKIPKRPLLKCAPQKKWSTKETRPDIYNNRPAQSILEEGY